MNNMNALKYLETRAQTFDEQAEAAGWQGRARMSYLYRVLSNACQRLTWMHWAPPHTSRSPKRRTRTADPDVAAHYIAQARAALRERNQ